MTAGRKPKAAAAEAHDPTDLAAVQAASAASTELAPLLQQVADTFADGQPYLRTRVISEARFFQAQTAEAMLELGKRLIEIKENEPHGEFVFIVEEQLGIPQRTARRFMEAAVKFLLPGSKRPALAVLGKTKMFELLETDDDQLDALAEGGTVAGLDLDDMAAMSSRELKAALIEARQTAAAKDKVIEKKNKKIDDLHEAEERRKSGTLPERETGQMADLRVATEGATAALHQLVHIVSTVVDAPATEATGMAARQTLDYVCQVMCDHAHSLGVSLNFEDQMLPAQMAVTRKAVAEHQAGAFAAKEAQRTAKAKAKAEK